MDHSLKTMSIRSVFGTIVVSSVSMFLAIGLAIGAGCSTGGGSSSSPGSPEASSGGLQTSTPSGASGQTSTATANTPPAGQQSQASNSSAQQPGVATGSNPVQTPGSPVPPAAPPAVPPAVPPAPGGAAVLILVSGSGQTGVPGTLLPTPLTLAVEDTAGLPVPGVAVAFAIATGGGGLSVTSAVTDSLGRAASALTLSPLEGTTSIVATVAGLAPATFTASSRLAPAQHADYYVAKGTGAFDSNDGLSPTLGSATHGPWLTMGHAVLVAQAGDIVHVSGGAYPENLMLGNDGTTTAPIRFYASMDEPVVLGSIRMSSRHFIEIHGFTVVGPKALPATWRDMPAVMVDDTTVGWIDPSVAWTAGRQALVDRKYATYVATVNAFNGPSYSLFTVGIWVNGSTGITVANNTVSLHTIGIDCDAGSTGITVEDNVAFHCRDGIWSYASSGTSFSSSLIDGNHCFQNLSAGISATTAASGVTISNNLCEYNAIHQVVVCSGSTLCTVRHNVAQYGGYYSETMQLPGSSAFNFYAVGAGNVADGNYAAYQYDPTLNDGNGFIVDTSSFPVTLTNNVAYRNQGTGITFTLTSGNLAVNNTLVENGYQSTAAFNGAGLRFSATLSTGNRVANNVFSANRVCGIHGAGVLSSQVVDFNLYDPGSPAIHDSYDQTKIYLTVAAVRQATGQETHGMTAAPLFVDPLAPDFHLQPASPAIGAGDPSGAPVVDNAGSARHTPPDLGAFEHP